MRNAHAELCRQRAQECMQYADVTSHQKERTQWLWLAQDWLKLAEDIEKCDREKDAGARPSDPAREH
jgi:hypothetical protein